MGAGKYEQLFGGKSAIEIVEAITDANDVWLTDEDNLNEAQEEAASRIHWLCHELECRLGAHGGTQYATGPLLKEE